MSATSQSRTKIIPARELRAGMFLYLRSDDTSYEVTDRRDIGTHYVSFLLGNGGTVLKMVDDLVHVVVMDHEY